MALGPCRECQREISSEATACPHCGAPVTSRDAASGCWTWGLGCAIVIGIAIAFITIASAIGSSADRAQEEDALPPGAKAIPVWSDTSARYWEISRSGSPDKPMIVTMRRGPSGTSFVERQYDCASHRFGVIAEGDSLNGMVIRSLPSMDDLIEGSISDIIGHHVCGKDMSR